MKMGLSNVSLGFEPASLSRRQAITEYLDIRMAAVLLGSAPPALPGVKSRGQDAALLGHPGCDVVHKARV